MALLQVGKNEKRAIAIATALAFVASFFFLRQYLVLLMVSAIVAYMFNPIYKRFVRRGKSSGTAAMWTLILSFLALIIPITLVLAVTTFQVVHLIEEVQTSNFSTEQLGNTAQHLLDSVNNSLEKVGVSYQINQETITNSLKTGIETVGNTIAKNAWSSISGIFGFITIAIIYIYVFLSMLKNQSKILEVVHTVNPLGRKVSELYVARMGSMTKAMARGQFIIATMQGLTDAALLYIGGIHQAFFFFAVLLIALSVIPLGGGILVLPIGVVMLMTGNIVGGLIVILGHIFIVTNIDNIMRPRLVPDDARLDPALTLLAVFAGVGMFGFLGVIIGPVIMIVLITTLQVYLEVFKSEDAVHDTKTKTKRTPLIKSIGTKFRLTKEKS